MTIAANTPHVVYTGNGASVAFTVPFKFFANSEVKVVLRTVATGIETVLELTTHYTLAGAGSATGTCTTVATYANTHQIAITRNQAFLQETDYVDGDRMTAATLEGSFDRGMAAVQEALHKANRALHLPVSDATARLTEIEDSVTRASKVLAFDASGDPVVSTKTLAQLETEADAAAASAIAAAGSAAAALVSENNAAGSAAAALASENNAAGSAAAALVSENNAAGSAAAALVSENNAAGSAAAALVSENNAELAETNAELAQLAAENARDLAIAAAATTGMRFNFDTSTIMADPGTGDMRANNADLSLVTALATSAMSADSGNPDISPFITTWNDSTTTVKGTLILREQGTPANLAVYSLTGTITDNGAWLQIPVTYVTHNGGFANADALVAQVSRTGDAGAGAVSSVGLALPTGVFDISGSPVTGSGTLTATFDTQAANAVFAGPTTGGAATPTFRAQVLADLPQFTATAQLYGRNTAGAGAAEEVTILQALNWIASSAQGDVLYRGASNWDRLAAGVSGQFLKTQGAGANPIWGAGGGVDVQTFTSSGTWTKPSNASRVVVHLWGGGGGGGRIGGDVSASGGAGGSYTRTEFAASALGATESVTIGAGGAGATGSNGVAGGNSSFGTFAYAIGGERGVAGNLPLIKKNGIDDATCMAGGQPGHGNVDPIAGGVSGAGGGGGGTRGTGSGADGGRGSIHIRGTVPYAVTELGGGGTGSVGTGGGGTARTFGGDGGGAGSTGTGGAGGAPAGGGGASGSGNGGAGARGECWVISIP